MGFGLFVAEKSFLTDTLDHKVGCQVGLFKSSLDFFSFFFCAESMDRTCQKVSKAHMPLPPDKSVCQ